ncbi:MAG: glutamine amidotransferase [Candidatus Aenigmatarchaeota archaeon]
MKRKNKIKVIYSGDYDFASSTFLKGFSSYTSGYFVDASNYLRKALESDPNITVKYISTPDANVYFPKTVEELKEYDVVILSDVPADTLLLLPGRYPPYKVPLGPNRLKSIETYVKEGGGLIMIGGWGAFTGLHGIAKYYDTPIEMTLPVNLLKYDDRVEVPEGFTPRIINGKHPIMVNIPWEKANFMLLGYNKTKIKKGATLLAEYNGDPILAAWDYYDGRSLAFTSDCAPHWGGNFIDWEYYTQFWIQAVKWIAKYC